MISNNDTETISELDKPQIEISFDDEEQNVPKPIKKEKKQKNKPGQQPKQKLEEKDYIDLLKLIDSAKNYEYPSEEIKQQELKEKEKRVKEIVDEIVKMIEQFKN
ncbi:hypothetical protein ACTA71_009427 [Dictyostelium dimigraforme]